MQGDTRLNVGQGDTAGSKTIQNGGPSTARGRGDGFQALLDLAAKRLGVPKDQLVARAAIHGRRGNPTAG